MMAPEQPIRVMLGMLGTDVHSKGIRTLSFILRDAGFEVIYLGEHNSARSMARAAAMEDVQVVGVSFSSGAYLHHVRELKNELVAERLGDVALMVGGLIHPDDHRALTDIGVAGIFGPGSTQEAISDFIRKTADGTKQQTLNDG